MTLVKATKPLSTQSQQEIQGVVDKYKSMGYNKYQIREKLAKKYCCGVSIAHQGDDVTYVLHLMS